MKKIKYRNDDKKNIVGIVKENDGEFQSQNKVSWKMPYTQHII